MLLGDRFIKALRVLNCHRTPYEAFSPPIAYTQPLMMSWWLQLLLHFVVNSVGFLVCNKG